MRQRLFTPARIHSASTMQGAPIGRALPGVAAATWSAAFAALHAYWARGGRAGLGAASDEADQAFAKPWFAAYNLAVTILSTVGALLAVASLRPSPGRVVSRLLPVFSKTASGALLARGAVGVTMLAVERDRTVSKPAPTLLVLIEPGFVLGGIAYGLLAHAVRNPIGRAAGITAE